MAPMNAETMAINTARPSPRRPKLKFKGKLILNWNGVPLIEWGKAIKEKITEILTKTNAVIFLAFFEIVLISGRTNAPAIGTKTINNRTNLAFI